MNQKQILVTGANGFLGSNISSYFLRQGYEVYGLVRKNSNLDRLSGILNSSHFHLLIIDELSDFERQGNLPQIAIHTATLYGRLNESEAEIDEANHVFPMRILALKGLKAFINSDTFIPDSYEKGDRYYLYAKTKKDFLQEAKSYSKTHGIQLVNLRIYQMFGPHDNATKFLPNIITQLLEQKSSIDLTLGQQKRDFIYIDDVVKAFACAVEKLPVFGDYEHFEIGTGESISIKQAVETLASISGYLGELNFGALPYSNNELMDSKADLSNNAKLGWKAETGLAEAFNKTIKSYANL